MLLPHPKSAAGIVIRKKAPAEQLPKDNDAALGELEAGGSTLAEWNNRWRKVEGGFVGNHHKFRHENGVFRALLRGERVYIGVGANRRSGGLAGRLSQFLQPRSTGAHHYGAQMIKAHLKNLDLEIILIGRGGDSIKTAKELGRELLKLSPKPVWNVRRQKIPIKPK